MTGLTLEKNMQQTLYTVHYSRGTERVIEVAMIPIPLIPGWLARQLTFLPSSTALALTTNWLATFHLPSADDLTTCVLICPASHPTLSISYTTDKVQACGQSSKYEIGTSCNMIYGRTAKSPHLDQPACPACTKWVREEVVHQELYIGDGV